MADPIHQPCSLRRTPQMSLAFMMLMMVIFAIVSAGLLYASRVPAVQDELQILFGTGILTNDDVGQTAHLAFIVFTLTSPLILAGVLSTGLSLVRWIDQRNQTRQSN